MKTFPFPRSLVLASLCLFFQHPAFPAEPAGWDREAFLKDVVLIPIKKRTPPMVGIKDVEARAGAPIADATKALYARTDDGDWKVFEDDVVRFEVPNDPLLKVQMLEPENAGQLQVVGGVVGTVDRSFSRAYRITVAGKLPYGIVMVREADWFDDGICFCGAIAFERYQQKDGTLLRYSLMGNGDVKKVEALGSKHRAMLFEWTHSAITQETYARIGASLRLKQQSPRTRAEWIAEGAKHDKRNWLELGWVGRGDNEKAVVELLGKPARRTAGALIYTRDDMENDGSGVRYTYTLPMVGGTFSGFAPKWCTDADIPPARGTVAWARRLIDPANQIPYRYVSIPGLDSKPKPKTPPKISKADRDLVFEKFLASEKGDKDQWAMWCDVVSLFHRVRKVRDHRVVPAIRRQFFDLLKSAERSMDVLESYEVADRQELYAKRLSLVLDAPPQDPPYALGGEAYYMFASLDQANAEYIPLLRRGLKNANPWIVARAIHFSDPLPPEEWRTIAKDALQSKNYEIREAGAEVYARGGNEKDLPWLRERLSQETFVGTQSSLESAIRRITSRAEREKAK